MKKAINMMAYILILVLVITNTMPLSVHAESGNLPTEEIFDDSTDEHIIIYHNGYIIKNHIIIFIFKFDILFRTIKQSKDCYSAVNKSRIIIGSFC